MNETPKCQHLSSEIIIEDLVTESSSENTPNSFPNLLIRSKFNIFSPSENAFLFDFPRNTKEVYALLFEDVERIIEDLQEKIILVNIRDDCCLLPKVITLTIPLRKQTN